MQSTSLIFADIILPLPLPVLYTYSIPENLKEQAEIGKRVIVNFGEKKLYTGLIKKIHNEKPANYETKPVSSILDSVPIVNEFQLNFWEWIAKYYMCSLGDIFKAALPSALKIESETKISFNKNFEIDETLNSQESFLISCLKNEKSISIKELSETLNSQKEEQLSLNINTLPAKKSTKKTPLKASDLKLIKSLIDKKAILVEENLKGNYRPLIETFVKLNDDLYEETNLHRIFNELTKAPAQLKMLMTFIQMSDHFNQSTFKEIKKQNLVKRSDVSPSVFDGLIKKKIFEIYEKETTRIDTKNLSLANANILSEAQQKAFEEINQKFQEKNVVLLHGVTASGKTEIYIHLIKETLKKGKQVLYLLPEIAITSQIINRLKNVFGNKAGIYHSKFNDAERVEIWNNVGELSKDKEKSYQIILGVRSSIFLPFDNLGLIIIDEEHENSYKQSDPAPRYHARDAAIVLAQMHGAKTLLGTATPAVETYFNAKNDKYGLVELNERHKNIQMPNIVAVDTKKLRKQKKMKSHFSPQLIEKIEETLTKNEQVILFQNRRGYSPFLECNTCGWIPGCKNCDVSLTYHRKNNLLVCHYCGYTIENTGNCLACEDTVMEAKGFGTEKLEEEISIIFPDAKIARMDLDTTRSKKAFQEIISNFETGKLDILIGTQMVTKGLDFDNVNLVGIMNADNMLHFPDFRAFERSYQLMAQVSGRAGRKNKQGNVIIQTSQPNHSIIKNVIDNDYKTMFINQLSERKEYSYPPYIRLIKIVLKHKDAQELNKIAYETANQMKTIFGKRVLGPEYPLVGRVFTWYQKQIFLKIEKEKSIVKARNYLRSIFFEIRQKYPKIQFAIDIDPV